MTGRRWIALGVLVTALLFVQHAGLEHEPEYLRERAQTHVGDLPARDMIPTYVASLFMGAFRAVAIDLLWIQLKKVEEERRWYERREILKMISYFQPRNPEVWAHLGWHSAYNVANGFADRDRGWEWVDFGLNWLRDGVDRLPESSYLKFELGRTLHHKPSWEHGKLDLDFMRRIEENPALQARLRPKGEADPGRPATAFELAVSWFARSRDQLHARNVKSEMTQVGLHIYKDTMDGFLREALYLQGIYRWKQGRREEAKKWFDRARRHVQEMLGKQADYYGFAISPIHHDYVSFYGGLTRMVDLEEKAEGGGPKEKREYALALRDLLVGDGKGGMLDQGYLWSPIRPGAPLNQLMRSLTGDPLECNDHSKLARPIQTDRDFVANLNPPEEDVDYYEFSVSAPSDDGHGHRSRFAPDSPLPFTLTISRPPESTIGLRITVEDPLRRELANVEVTERTREIQFDGTAYGAYEIRIEALDPSSISGPSTYGFRVGRRR